MKYLGLLLSLCLLAFVISDAVYIASAWTDFDSDDATRHIQFQIASALLVLWHCSLTWRAWPKRVHGNLVLAFLGLAALIVAFFTFLPLYQHGGTSVGSLALLSISLASAVGIMAWAWRVSGAPNNSFKPNPLR